MSDFDWIKVSHYSDNDAIFDDDRISGTMQGLVNFDMFDSNSNCHDRNNVYASNEVKEKEASEDNHDRRWDNLDWEYKAKYERLKEQMLELKSKYNLPDDSLNFMD